MIKSAIDNDLYKFTMMYAILVNPELMNLRVRYGFFNRNDIQFPDGFDKILQGEVNRMGSLRLTRQEKRFIIKKLYFLPLWFFDFLEGYQFDPSEVIIKQEGGNLMIDIDGSWFHTIPWEVPLLALVSELYHEVNTDYDFDSPENRKKRLENNRWKADLMVKHGLSVSEFGTRRRFSFDNQNEVIEDLKKYATSSLTGTSNMYLGYIHDLPIHGTNAHEWYMIHAALYGYIMANKKAIDNWMWAFRGSLGTALPDTFTTDVFLRTFDLQSAKLYDSTRQDSGDPYKFTDKIVNHYNDLRIDTASKGIIYSDGINIPYAIKLKEYAKNKNIKDADGIGTDLTCNLEGVKPLNIVIKVTQVYYQDHWIDCVKLSDNMGKHTGKAEEIKRCKDTLNIGDVTYDKQPSGNEGDVAHVNLIK
jgi:nicotinate phosphoribosyltransferase